jgi:hypothetical protein
VNGGLAGASVGGETSASASCERMDRESDQQEETRAGETAWFDARPRVTRDRHPAVVTLPERWCGSRGTGVTKRAHGQCARCSRPPDPTKGPYRWKASRIEGSVTFYEGAWRAVSAAHSPKGPARATQKVAGGYSKEAARAKARETEGESGRRQGCQRLGCIGHRGKKTPTLVNEVGDDFGARCSTEVKPCSIRSAEAVRTS